MVCARLSNNIDLIKLENVYHGLCYQPPGFPALCLKDDVSTLCQIFKNGKIVVIGGKSVQRAKTIFDEYMQRVSELGFDSTYNEYSIQNIVARLDIHHKIDLRTLAKHKNITYQPEIFPSAVKFRLKDLKVTANIFYSGKIMILGAKSMPAVEAAVQKILELV